jgi:NADH dehydrogenase [ubiquinone] 1 alpha subcomplex assembly factor 5
MSATSQPPEIFDRRRRRAIRERAGMKEGGAFLWDVIADDLAERLAFVTRQFERVLVIGPIAARRDFILGSRDAAITVAALAGSERTTEAGIILEEDRLPFEPASFDLVISAGTLDSVNDLPGALIQIRRCLKPDGLFLGHMFGAGTLGTLKSMMLAAEGDAASPHAHPQIDLRSAADLLSRAGFALPVADQDVMPVRYGSWRSLVADLRHAGLGNALSGPRRYLGKDLLARLDELWVASTEERFTHLYLTGWAPSSDQPRPAARGSGEVSLASIFPSRIKD